jgi:hypothetical protein
MLLAVRSSVRIRKVYVTDPQISASELWIRIQIRIRKLPNLFFQIIFAHAGKRETRIPLENPREGLESTCPFVMENSGTTSRYRSNMYRYQ